MTEHFNGLTPAEDERLAMLAEECAEVIKIGRKLTLASGAQNTRGATCSYSAEDRNWRRKPQ